MQIKKIPVIMMIIALLCTTALAESPRSGSIDKHLGVQSIDFGSKKQAQTLLDFIESEPSKSEYRLIYVTEIDLVIFGCDFNKGVLFRVHQRKGNHGTQEGWQGYILERLESAAEGGSLNDTPSGKIPGIYETF
ncbi:hypothetical protein CSB45_16075 [candidate division KSB3 bacterium]|uniref:TPM domain-containing protein n=1 Tax=candidate division KSB3 bacterium TaxID=2044937 RepID=A0A2G6E0C9_9BACT|nr:MAG: hypothetical protein CSB45_16075 [candidate division KSB3 bacterium]